MNTTMFHVKHAPARPHYSRLLVLLLVAAMMTQMMACAVSTNPLSGRSRAFGYTWQQEVQLGQQADQEIVQVMGIYEDPGLQAYVEGVGERVLAESHLRRPDADPEFRQTPFTFRVIDSPVVNAFALPGGFVYVTRGLLNHLNNEAQLALVLGHEIVHVAGRHASRQAFQAQLGQLGVIGGAVLGQAVLGGQAGSSILNLGSTAASLLLLSYGRDAERESDQHGVAYSAQAGYDAAEGAEFFVTLRRMGEQAGGGLPSFLSTHPDPGEREQTIRSLAADWRQRVDMEVVNQDAYYAQIEGTVMGQDPRQGFVEGGVFYHPELRFRFPVPGGFLVDNQRTQVGMIERENQQAAIIFAIASGASTASAAAANFGGQEGLSVQDSRSVTVNGLPAHALSATARLESGQDIGLLSYFIEHGGNVYYFIGYSALNAFSQYRDTFQRTMTGFAPEASERILSVQPARLRLLRTDRSAPFASFVSGDLPGRLTPEDLAIMNQVDLNEQIPQGTVLKVPR